MLDDLKLIIILILAIFNVFSLLVGFLIGRINSTGGVSIKGTPPSFFDNQKQKAKISIDDTKIVTNIDISNIEKKYTSLGETKTSNENISESINKLKSLKR